MTVEEGIWKIARICTGIGAIFSVIIACVVAFFWLSSGFSQLQSPSPLPSP
jgi:hypothetical protein